MEEKVIKARGSIRSIFDNWCSDIFLFFTKFNSQNTSPLLLKSKGFTLVEIIIVVALIGVLAGGLITILDPAGQLKSSRDSKRKSDLKQIQAALELYRADQGIYPDNSDIGYDVANNPSNTSLVDNPTYVQATYLQTVPKDPRSSAHYYYCRIYACLEKSNDPDRTTGTPPSYLGCASGSSYMFVTNP